MHIADPAHPETIYGVMAAFAEPRQLLDATRAAREAGYRRMDAFTPFPVEGLDEELGMRYTRLPLLVLAAGILGAIGGYALQYYCSVIAYPLNIGGRPLHSWPAFIPVTFEVTVLFAGIAAVLGMLALNGLPTPYHPVFNVPEFGLASRDRFFLLIESRDPKFDPVKTADFLRSLEPLQVSLVPR
jgi:hypothetical protein